VFVVAVDVELPNGLLGDYLIRTFLYGRLSAWTSCTSAFRRFFTVENLLAIVPRMLHRAVGRRACRGLSGLSAQAAAVAPDLQHEPAHRAHSAHLDPHPRAEFGGSISSILMNVPGEASAAATRL